MITGSGITSFSPFGVLNSSAALPLYSISINANRVGDNNKITWNIIAPDMQEISIEKSTDGRSFSTLQSQGFISAGSVLDVVNSSKIYYRIKLKDLQGKLSYSRIIWVNGKQSEVQVFPTLFTNNFTVNQTVADKIDLVLMDVSGKVVLKQPVQQGFTDVNASSLPKGSYIYQLKQHDTITAKGVLIKQ